MPSPGKSDPQQAQKSVEAMHFLVEVRRRPDVMARLRMEPFDIDDLVSLGTELGFQFDASALHEAFRNDFKLRLAISKQVL